MSILLFKPGKLLTAIIGIHTPPPLELLYEWLECDTIEVPGNGFRFDGELQQFVVDEEGKLKGKPVNTLATERYNRALAQDPRGLIPDRDVLVGNVVILTWPHLLT